VNLEEYRQMYELENTHWYFRGKKTLVRKVLRALLDETTSYKLLDVGCGTGNILSMLQEFGEAVGVDTSPVALEFCRTRNLSALHLTKPGEALPFSEQTFDVACAFDLLEHIEDDLGFLTEMKRVTRTNGKIVLIIPAHPQLWSDHDVALHHKRRYTRAQFKELIAGAGLECQRMTYLNSVLFPAAVGYRMLKKVLPRKESAPVQSEFFVELPAAVNTALLKLFQLEGALLPRKNLPFGLSLLAVCRNPG
jgi:ubiquinone/menaquinone biosynthesis C-methylase UbiE